MIKSSVFGSVTLSGEDARKFERQVRYGRPSQAAQDTLLLGDKLLKQFGGGASGGPVLSTDVEKGGRAKLRPASGRSK